jgi:photosystem II stability/assembly factor-like uncharacterized protein
MTTQRILRRLLPALLLCALATVAVAQPPGVWNATSRPGNASHNLYTAHFIDGRSGYVAGTTGGLAAAVMYRTTDGGVTWTAVAPPGATTAINDIFFLDGDLKGYIAGDANYFAITTDGGATWTNRTLPLGTWSTPTDIQALYFMSETRGWVVGKVAGGNGPRMARTTDGGLTWAQVSMTGPANNLHDIDFFDQTNGLAVGTGNPTRKSRSSDAGTTWEPNADMGALQTESVSMYGLDAVEGSPLGFAAGGKNFASPLYPVVRRTTDYGATWTNLISTSTPLMPKPASDIIALGPQVLYVAGQDAKIIRSVDGGVTWTAETVNPPAGSTPDFRKFSLTRDNYLWVVGSSGAVLRTRLVPDVTFAPTPPINFGTLCPGDVATQTMTIGNTGLGVLDVAGASIIQPPVGTIQFSLILPTVSRVWPKTTQMQRMSVLVGPGTQSGTHLGEITIASNDENGSGADAFRRIQLSVTVPENGIGIDSTVPRDLGTVRLGGLRAVTLTGLLRNVSTTCKAPIDTVYLVRGLDFRLVPPFVGRDTLRPLERRSVLLEFSPSRICARYDTLVVLQSGGAVRLRIPIVGTGVEATYATSPVDTLRFGSVQIGASGSATLKLVNRKPGSCLDRTALQSLIISGPNASEFSTTVRFTPGVSFIPADGEISVPFDASPTAIGPRIAYAVIRHELSAEPDTVVLFVNGTDAELTTTDEVVFAVTGVGMRRDTTVTAAIRNLGAGAVTIVSASLGGGDPSAFVLVSPQAPRTLARGASDSIVLGFVPNRVGMFSATLELRSDRGTVYSIRLVGEGADASGSLGRDPIVFTATSVGDCHNEIVERFIVNTGRVPLVVRGLAVQPHPRGAGGDETRFTIVSPLLPPEVTIAPGDSLRVELRFCPERLGEHVASLAITSNIPGAPLLDTLIGEGIRARIVSADSILFAPTRLGTARDSAFDPFLLNMGASSLTVMGVSIVGDDAGDFALSVPTPPFSVAAGATLPATVTFRPNARGPRTATLRIMSSQGVHDITLAGVGIYPLLDISGTINPRVRVGRSLSIDYTIINRGDDSGRVDSAWLSGSPAFAISSSSLPTTLAPNASARLTLTFTPPVECEHKAALTVAGEGATDLTLTGDTSLMINGIGTMPRLNARADTVDFGSVTVGATRDSVLDGFVANLRFDDPSLLCVDSVAIDAITISGTDAMSFEVITPFDPRTILQPGDGLVLSVRFRPTRTGVHVADLAIAFDGASDSVLHVTLIGNADALPEVSVGLSFGADHVTKPGDVIRVPITLGGDIAGAAIDTLVVDVAYHRSLLRLDRIVTTGGAIGSFTVPDVAKVNLTSTITILSDAPLPAGSIAEMEFTVLLGSVVAADVFADSARAPGHPEVLIASDSANVSIEEFCNASGRLITFGGAVMVKASPNPVRDAVTIEYTLPANAPVLLAIYDAGGRAVATIVDGELDAGAYAITLDTRELAAGTYYCRLSAGRFEDSAVIRVEK